ncbi:MAG: menaquinone biosynthesis decarboxylase [Nitrospiraceae bacterium]|nr:menaquinone biosynthesis decarboxylase [Nitrospiraceae bacterium]
MENHTLQMLIQQLEKSGQLRRISVETDPVLEISEITLRAHAARGPALLFEKVLGSELPVLTNLFGTPERLELIFGRSVQEITDLIAGFLSAEIPTSFRQGIQLFPKLKRLQNLIPKKGTNPACQEIVSHTPSLEALPVLKTWPGDAGRFVTLPQVITQDPETGDRNIGMYRLQVFDNTTTGMHWHPHKDGARHFRKYKERGQRMPVTVALGGDPLLTYLATAPLPEEISEWMFAGLLRGSRVSIAPCITNELYVPANADIALEGYIDPDEPFKEEGPFGDHTGFYSPPEPFPVFHITCMTRKKNAVYPATVVGPPPMEDAAFGKMTERIFLPIIQKLIPGIIDIDLPVHGCFHNFVLVAIDKQYPGQARKTALALWGLGQMMFSKFIIVFDKDVNIHNYGEAAWRLGTHVDPVRDTFTINSAPTDLLDHTSPLACLGGKMGIDATRKWTSEGFTRPWPGEAEMSQEMIDRVTKRWKAYGLDF